MRILIAEDEIYSAMALQQMLAGRGLDVKLAYDGEQALELLRRHSFDLALLDADMPNLDGYGVAAAVRSEETEQQSESHLLLIHFSGYALPDDELLAKGFDAQIQKPLTDPDQLYQLIDRLMNSARA